MSKEFIWTDELVVKYAATQLGDTIQDIGYFKEQVMKSQQPGWPILPPELLDEMLSVTKTVMGTIQKMKQAKKEMEERKAASPVDTVVKDWEIVSVIRNDEPGKVYTLSKSGPNKGHFIRQDKTFSGVSICGFNGENLDMTKVALHSVKRPSDGEVFTVGDEIEWFQGTTEKITSFSIYIDTKDIRVNVQWGYEDLKDSKKATPVSKDYGLSMKDADEIRKANGLYTQQELDKAIEDAFAAATAVKIPYDFKRMDGIIPENVQLKYPTFADYLNSLKK